jgi:hypothetical protein
MIFRWDEERRVVLARQELLRYLREKKKRPLPSTSRVCISYFQFYSLYNTSRTVYLWRKILCEEQFRTDSATPSINKVGLVTLVYTRQNAQVVTGLSANKLLQICSQAVDKLCSHCLFPVVVTSVEQAVNNL